MYRMNEFAVAVRARGHITFYADNVHFDNVNRHVRFVPFSRLQYTVRESQQRSNVVGLGKIYSVGAFDLAPHRIVISAEHYRVFAIFIVIAVTNSVSRTFP